MDRLDGMAAFAAVAETGSFTGAAARLGLSRALVGKRVAALEAALGARLLNRTTRRVSLTGPGAEVLERCRVILAEYDQATALVQRERAEPAGRLKVNGPMSFGMLHLAPAVFDFMRAHPRLQVQLTLTDRFVDLIDEGYDLGVRIGALEDSSLMARRLAPARRVVCAAPGYVAAHGAPAHPHDLARHRCLHYGYLAGGTRWRFTGPDGAHAVPVEPTLCVNNGDVLLEAAVAGLGVALLPTFICGPALRDGRLVRLLPDWAPPEIAINAIWPTSRLLPAKVRLFIDFLAARFAGQPAWDAVA